MQLLPAETIERNKDVDQYITIEQAAREGHRFEFKRGKIFSRQTGQQVIRQTHRGLAAASFNSPKSANARREAEEEDQQLGEALDRARARGLQIGSELSMTAHDYKRREG